MVASRRCRRTASQGSVVKRVLVTGASGFIGSHTLESLVDRGYDVHAVASRAIPFEREGVTWHQANLLDDGERGALVARVEPTHLLHLAWFVAPGKVIDAVVNVDWTRASLALYEEFVASGGQRAVTAGSSYEYDWRFGYCSEEVTPLVPDTVYGSCKKALGEVVSAYAGTCGLASAWPRIFFLYGPREHPDRLVSSVVRSLLDESPALCSRGAQIRDYLFVEDAADALVALLDSDVSGPVNIGSGRPITVKELVLTDDGDEWRPDLIRLGAIPARANDAPTSSSPTSADSRTSSAGRRRAGLDAGPRRTDRGGGRTYVHLRERGMSTRGEVGGPGIGHGRLRRSSSFPLGGSLLGDVRDAAVPRRSHGITAFDGGWVFDADPHISFTKVDRVEELFAESVDGDYREIGTNLNNYWKGHWIEHPAQCNLYGLPADLVARIVLDFVEEQSAETGEVRNYADWLVASFGRTFAETFPMEYGLKFHTTTAEDIDDRLVGPRLYRADLGGGSAGRALAGDAGRPLHRGLPVSEPRRFVYFLTRFIGEFRAPPRSDSSSRPPRPRRDDVHVRERFCRGFRPRGVVDPTSGADPTDRRRPTRRARSRGEACVQHGGDCQPRGGSAGAPRRPLDVLL